MDDRFHYNAVDLTCFGTRLRSRSLVWSLRDRKKADLPRQVYGVLVAVGVAVEVAVAVAVEVAVAVAVGVFVGGGAPGRRM